MACSPSITDNDMGTLEYWLPTSVIAKVHSTLKAMATSISAQTLDFPNQGLDAETEGTLVLLISPEFSLVCHTQPQLNTNGEGAVLTISTDPERIAVLLARLQGIKLGKASQTKLNRAIALHQRTPNVATLQDVWTHRLIQALSTLLPEDQEPTVAACQPMVDAALNQQLEQERLIHQVTTQIRQSLELPVILSTAAEQVRQILQVDRFVIYQFQQPEGGGYQLTPWADEVPEPEQPCCGTVTHESLGSKRWTSALNFQENYCWTPTAAVWQKYEQGRVVVLPDAQAAYPNSACMGDFLKRLQVRAKLVVPVLVQARLWGLLIAHQCSQPREWQESDVSFVQQIAEHLAVAIAQAQLYQQLQQQTQTLEYEVDQRTQELRDALVVAQSANQAKTEFLATMSHELRTPLTCVIGMSSTLLRWSLGPLNEKQRTYLQTIHDNGEHLLDLINDILDLSRVESGKAALSIGEFSIASLAHQSLQMLADKAKSRNINLRAQFKIPPGSDRFLADARRLKQILFNLLSNAIKFTPAGGQVILRVWLEPNSVVFQVEDTGIGIPKAKQSLLFQKFQQLDTSYRRAYEGTGLGLALVKHFVEMHRGWIDVRSEEGQGSIFTVEIPQQVVNPTNTALGLAGSQESPTRQAGRVILLEQQDESATLICDILTAAGYQVIWLLESTTAVHQARLIQPVVMILNAHLPGVDAIDLIGQLRQVSELEITKLVVLTQEKLAEDEQPFLNAGADAYLSKPIDPQHLMHKLEMLLSSIPQLI
jgi:two-component system sensor histidine kinase/response regulator